MSSKKAKVKGIIKLLVFLVAGIFIGWIIATANILPPSSHQSIANKVKVDDVTLQVNLTLTFEKTGIGYSFWTFRWENKASAAMWIREINQSKYWIGVAKFTENRIDVTLPNGTRCEDITYVSCIIEGYVS